MARTIRKPAHRQARRTAERAMPFEPGPWFIPAEEANMTPMRRWNDDPANWLRIPTAQVTLNTWTVRVNGTDLVNVELDAADVPAVRRLVEHAECWGRDDACHAVWVSIGRTANERGILLALRGDEPFGARCPHGLPLPCGGPCDRDEDDD